ncbi:hypothetical protein [Streptomyces jeddahensis]|uniref:Uncharacterized protein n=1 Tax=Streptomyces jeddahensis TaxID=1716141 RepID=A0A177HS84_9ACTN|nr:hypothetical protein [Streptomyces jeddahensis]OAH13044.1 hypothetical protein STSP_36910 [Streptomyces jeddahensis]
MPEEAPVIVSPPQQDGGRRVVIRGEQAGTAYTLFDLLEFLRGADLPETDTAVDDPELIDWRGGGPDVWNAEPPAHG